MIEKLGTMVRGLGWWVADVILSVITKESTMPNDSNRGGSHEQHVRAGQQSRKNDDTRQAAGRDNDSTRGGTHEQHVKAGQQSHKNDRQ